MRPYDTILEKNKTAVRALLVAGEDPSWRTGSPPLLPDHLPDLPSHDR
ncbi:hypothetical protein STENM327S_00317 [Streptomyces tendae]